MQSIALGPYVLRVETEAGKKLGIDTGVPASGFAVKSFEFNQHNQCLVVREDRIDYWRADQIREIDKKVVIVGPWLDIESLSLAATRSQESLESILPRLQRAWEVCADHPEYQGRIFGGSCFLCEDGSVLILPALWGRQILHHQNSPSERQFSLHLARPGRAQSFAENQRFALGVLSYRLLAKSYPVELPSLTEADLDNFSRKKLAGIVEPLELRVPETPPALSREIHRHILAPEEADSNALIDLLRRRSELAKNEEPEDQKKLRKIWERRKKFFEWKELFRKRRGAIVAGAIIGLLVISGLSSLISRALTPPVAQGWPPERVVEQFYDGINELDVTVMDGLVRQNAGRDLRNLVLQMYATTRVREAYEYFNPHVSPAEWRLQGRPPLEDSTFLFGVDQLEIHSNRLVTDRESTRPLRKLEISYQYYTPDISQSPEGEISTDYFYEDIREAVFLEYDRETWFIVRIEPILED